MYIITTGRVRSYYKTESAEAELRDQTKGRVLTANDTFGELCTLGLSNKRQETVVAEAMTDFLCISKQDLFSTLGETAPHILTDMRRRVIRKYKKLHRHKDRRLSFTAPTNELLKMIRRQREKLKEETGERSNSKISSRSLTRNTSTNYVGIDVERGKSQDDLVTHFPYGIVGIG